MKNLNTLFFLSTFLTLVMCSTVYAQTSVSVDGGDAQFAAPAWFSPSFVSVSAAYEQVDDGTDTTTDGCEPTSQDLSGKIALVTISTCAPDLVAANAQNAGAVGLVICSDNANLQQAEPEDGTTTITIPVITATAATCTEILASSGTVTLNGPIAGERCSDAIVATDGINSADTIAYGFGGANLATSTTHALWYTYTAPMGGVLNVNSCSGGQDTRLYLWTQDDCGEVLTGLINGDFLFNDDQCETSPGSAESYASALSLFVNPGQTVYFAWSDRWADGPFTFNVNMSAGPADCTSAANIFTENFETYDDGDFLAQSPDRFTTWPGATSIGDIVTASFNKSLRIAGDIDNMDAILNLGDQTSGHYLLNWNMEIPAGKEAYFNLQHEDPAVAPVWAVELQFNGDGNGELTTGAGVTQNFVYPEDEEFGVWFVIDIENDVIKAYINDLRIFSWQWSVGFTNGGVDSPSSGLHGVNFFPLNDNNEYFVDDISFAVLAPASQGYYCYLPEDLGSQTGTFTVPEPICYGGMNFGRATGAYWFTWTAPEDGWISVSSCEQGVDTRTWIMTGDCEDPDILAIGEDNCLLEPDSPVDTDWASYREATVVGGQQYFIMWDNSWSSAGFDFTLDFSTEDLVEGRFCESAFVIEPDIHIQLDLDGEAVYGAFTRGFSTKANPAPYTKSTWYQWTPEEDGIGIVSTCDFVTEDTRVLVYTGTCGTWSTMELVADGEDECGLASEAVFDVVADETYYIEWVGVDNGNYTTGNYEWELEFSLPRVPVIISVDVNELPDVAPDGIKILASWEDFAVLDLQDRGNGIWADTFFLLQENQIQYKFLNGSGNFEPTDQLESCGVPDGFGGFNRVYEVGTEGVELDLVCYSRCTGCEVSTNEPDLPGLLNLSPNPARETALVTYQLEDAIGLELRLSSTLGQQLYRVDLGSASTGTYELDLSDLRPGVYFVTLTDGQRRRTQRLTVQ